MSFLNQCIEEASRAFQDKNYYDCVVKIGSSFDAIFQTENREEISITLALSGITMIKKICDKPSIDSSPFVNETLTDLSEAISQVREPSELSLLHEPMHRFLLLVAALKKVLYTLHYEGLTLYETDRHNQITIQERDDIITVNRVRKVIPNTDDIEEQNDLDQILPKVDFYIQNSTSAPSLFAFVQRLTQAGRYRDSIMVLSKVFEQFPNYLKEYHNMLGINFFFLFEYERAIEEYLNALKAGANIEMIDFNVWEACTELIERFPDQKDHWKRFYEKHFPNGIHEIS